MRIPKTSRRPSAPLAEIALGRGDYVAGGAQSLPFLDLDGARRRRPLVFGEITDDMTDYPEVASGMFSGRQNDPGEWAVMWKEIGADGILIDLHDQSADLVREVSERTRLPVAVVADDGVLEEVSGIEGSRMILVGRGHDYGGPHGEHVVSVTADGPGIDPSSLPEPGRCVIRIAGFGIDRLAEDTAIAEGIRGRGLSGEAAMGHPIMADVRGCWNRGFGNAREASMWEAESALAAMLAGADIVIVRGPGAADMARVYGEELADL